MGGKDELQGPEDVRFVLTGYQDHPAPRQLPPLSLHAVAQGSPTSRPNA